MLKITLLTLTVFLGWIATGANPPILPKGNWSEKCRRMTNELGREVNAGKFLSIKGSYSTPTETQLFWTVTSYKDKNCSSFNDANRYTYECVPSDNKKLGKILCTQTKWEKSSELGKWTETPMVDHKGQPNVGKSYVTTKRVKSGKIELTQVDFESEEGQPVLLSKSSE